MKRKLLSLTLAAVLALSLTACGGGSDTADTSTDAAETTDETTEETTDASESTDTAAGEVANADKPLVWFNRQPSNSST